MDKITEIKVIMSEVPQKRIENITNGAGMTILILGILMFVLSFVMLALGHSSLFTFEIVTGIAFILLAPIFYYIKKKLLNRIKNTEIVATEMGVSYYLNTDSGMNEIFNLPIDKIREVYVEDNLSSESKGRTVRIETAERNSTIMYVLNADEVVAFLKTAMQKAKEGFNEQQDAPSFEEQELQPQRSQGDIADSLKKIAELRDAGIITEEEFEQKKRELMGF